MIGSSRREHGKVFYYPHVCSDCKSNISVDLLSESKICSKCSSLNIHIYGESVTEAPFDRWHKIKGWITGRTKRDQVALDSMVGRSLDISYCYNLRTTYALLNRREICPKCKNKTLRFSLSNLFD
jgi:Zn finger protein HypA/HybF involved in hydrogenase expression